MNPIRLVILGQPASKANSRKLVTMPDGKGGTRAASIKSDEARAYAESATRQIPPKCRLRLEGPVRFTARIYYASERPDLDESVILDCLQDVWAKVRVPGEAEPVRQLVQAGVYRNDRQVRERHVFHGIDKLQPRAEIEIETIGPDAPTWNFNPAYGWTPVMPSNIPRKQGALL